MPASVLKRDLKNLIQRNASLNFQAQNGLLSLRSWWRSVRSLIFSIGLIMACGGLGSMLGPFIMGRLADRYFATEKVLAACHLAGGVLLIAASYGTTFWPVLLLMLLYCTLYFPTVSLTHYSGPPKVDHSGHLHLLRLFPS